MAIPLHVKAKSAWKSVDIPKDLLSDEAFSGLIDVQVLTDYDLIQSDVKDKSKKRKRKASLDDGELEVKVDSSASTESITGTGLPKKKRKREKRSKNDDRCNSETALETPVSPSETKRNKKKKKKTKSVIEGKVISLEDVEDVSQKENEVVSPASSAQQGKKKKKKAKGKKKQQREAQLEDDQREGKTVLSEVQPKPKLDMSEWNNLFVPEVLLQALEDQGFEHPSQIQKLVLPSAIRDRKDILGAAETGSGKTLAFGIPVLSKILNEFTRLSEQHGSDEDDNDNEGDDCDSHDEDDHEDDMEVEEAESKAVKQKSGQSRGSAHPMALILEPTRELAVQVKNHLTALAAHTDIKFVTVVGGMSVEKQRRILSKHPHVIIATPGRLWQLIEEGNEYLCYIDQVLSLVVDEADRMVEKGHFEELTKLMELLNKSVNHRQNRQTFVMSATLTMDVSKPKRLLNKAKKKVKNEDKLKTLTEKICLGMKPKVIDLTPKDKVAQTLTELRVNCKATEKDVYLYYFLCQHPGRTLVFVNSKDCLRRLVSVFTLLQCHPLPLHADMHQRQRLKNLDRFTEQSSALLLASDVAARGLDIPKVDHVIHYQVPRTMETYIHRSGRTARASNLGLSVMLVGPDEAKNYRKIVHGVKNGEELPLLPIEQMLVPAAQQRVQLARQIDVSEYRIKKKKVRNNFFLKAAEDMDMIIDYQHLLSEMGDTDSQSQDKHQLLNLRRQLSSMLVGGLAPLRMTKYPTKSGQLPKQRVINLFDTAAF